MRLLFPDGDGAAVLSSYRVMWLLEQQPVTGVQASVKPTVVKLEISLKLGPDCLLKSDSEI